MEVIIRLFFFSWEDKLLTKCVIIALTEADVPAASRFFWRS